MKKTSFILVFSIAVFFILPGCDSMNGMSGDPPTAPRSLSVSSVSKTEINLSWTDNSESENGFSVERKLLSDSSFKEIDTVDAEKEKFTDSGLTADTTYEYRIAAFNDAGKSEYSSVVEVTTPVGGGEGEIIVE